MSSAREPDPGWIVPDWPAPTRVKSLITTRSGGASVGPYASFNVGFSTADEARAVETNRSRLRAVLPAEPKWLKQIHGPRVVAAEAVAGRPEADASVAREPGVVCAIQIADCLPILFAEPSCSVVAAAHAGWRGLAAGVVENTVAAMQDAGVSAADIIAYMGPGIGPDAFEVGDEVRHAYVSRDAGTADAFRPHAPGKWLADLPALARRALSRCGVSAIYGGTLCTYSDPQRFYSYRRDKVTGRMVALIWLEP